MYKLLFIFILLCSYGANAQITLNIDIKTGDDNLERKNYQKNPEIIIKLRDGREVRKANINRGQTWDKDSLRRVAVELPENASLGDITEFVLERQRDYGTGGYRFDTWEKDDWVVKAITITAAVRESGRSRNVPVANFSPRGNVYRFTFDSTTAAGYGFVYTTPISYGGVTPTVALTSRNAAITVTFGTGADDLRGRGDNVSVTLRLRGSPATIDLENLNGGTRLAANSERIFTKEIPNSSTLNIDNISEVVVRHDGGGSNDEWVINKVQILIKKTVPVPGTPGPGRETTRLLVNDNYPSIHRFTSRSRQKSFSANANQTALRNATITAVFTTGDDDLRGGGDNVDLVIRTKRSRQMITIRNLNKGENWPGPSTRTIRNKELLGSDDIDIDDIESVEVRHTGGGGFGADNWNLAAFKLTITKDGRTRELVDQVRRLIYRFTGESRSKLFVIE